MALSFVEATINNPSILNLIQGEACNPPSLSLLSLSNYKYIQVTHQFSTIVYLKHILV